MPELFLAEALGAAGKPLLRVHTAGSVGGSTAIVAVVAGAGGRAPAGADRRLREAVGVQRDVGAVGAAAVHHAGARRRGRLLRAARALLHPPLRARPTHIGAIVAAKDRQNALKNPYAHLRNPDTTVESVLASQMLWDPIRYDETCPSSDGACALVIADEDTADGRRLPRLDPRHRDALGADHGRRARPGQPAGRPRGRRRALEAGRDHRPARTRSTRPRSTCRSRGSSRCGWRTSASPPRARAGSSPSPAAPPRRRAPGQLLRRRALVQPDRRLRDAPLRRGGAPGARAGPASTRSTACAARSATPTAAARSSSRCGSSDRSSRPPDGCTMAI